MTFQQPTTLATGERALTCRAGRWSELHAFLGDCLVFDGGVPKVWDPLPVLEQTIRPGDVVVEEAPGVFRVEAI